MTNKMNAIQFFDWGGEPPFKKDLRLEVIQSKDENKRRFLNGGWGFKDTLGNFFFFENFTSDYLAEYGWAHNPPPYISKKEIFSETQFANLNKDTIISSYVWRLKFAEDDSYEAILQNIKARVNDRANYTRIISKTRYSGRIVQGPFGIFANKYIYVVDVTIDGENLPIKNYKKMTSTI